MVKTAIHTKERQTSQKKIIYDYLISVKTHPTAEDVYVKVKKKLPQISQGTVYRILNNFNKKSKAQIILSKSTAHFDADISMHAHFICENCERVYDVINECSSCNIIKKKGVSLKKVGKINSYMIYFYGKCNKCAK